MLIINTKRDTKIKDFKFTNKNAFKQVCKYKNILYALRNNYKVFGYNNYKQNIKFQEILQKLLLSES